MSFFRTEVSFRGAEARVLESRLFSNPNKMIMAQRPEVHARVSRFDLGGLTVGEVISSGHEVNVSEYMANSLIVPLSGAIECESKTGLIKATTGEALFFSPNRRHTRVSAGKAATFKGIPLIISTDLMRAAFDRLGLSLPAAIEFDALSLRMNGSRSAATTELLQTVRTLHAEIDRGSVRIGNPASRAVWAEFIADKIVDVLQETGVLQAPVYHSDSSSYRSVRMALDYMRVSHGEIKDIPSVAKVCGVSMRSLELAFKHVLKTTPSKALLGIRLEAARKRLCDPNEEASVTEVALDCGFNHLSRFSAAYREKFHELPSQTLVVWRKV